jgi:hypothetical protein
MSNFETPSTVAEENVCVVFQGGGSDVSAVFRRVEAMITSPRCRGRP